MNIKNSVKDYWDTILLILLLVEVIMSILYMKETIKVSEVQIPLMYVSLLILLIGIIAVIWKKEDFDYLIELVKKEERPIQREEQQNKRKEPFDFMEVKRK